MNNSLATELHTFITLERESGRKVSIETLENAAVYFKPQNILNGKHISCLQPKSTKEIVIQLIERSTNAD